MKQRQRLTLICMLSAIIGVGIVIGVCIGLTNSKNFTCTPSQEYQQVITALSGLDEKIEFLYQLSEVK